MTDNLRLVPCGDRAVLLYLSDQATPAVNERIHGLTRALKQRPHPALVEITPASHCLMIEYDPLRIRLEQLEEMAREALADAGTQPADSHTVAVPVCYGGECGPDLGTVADHTGLTPEEVIRRHQEPLYRVYCLGFSPGFPYLGDLDPSLHTPRLAEPRIRVPAGAVGIGGTQTGIYPAPSPGGWQLIGRTPLRLFDPHRDSPALLEPGNTVRFVSVSPERFAELEQANAAPKPARPAYMEGRAGVRMLQPGLATTVQDLGRRGYQAYGVPVAGAADFWSLMVGNWLLGNRARTSALEITMSGPEIEFTGVVAFCITGAPIPAELIPADGLPARPLAGWHTLLAGPGDRVRIGTAAAGCRSYLCVAGGFDLRPVLGSLSEDLFGKLGPVGGPLKGGDWLPVGLPLHSPADIAGRALPAEHVPEYTGQITLRVVRGPQADAFSAEGFAAFLGGEYAVSPHSDRQGLRLQGPQIAHAGRADILSEPIAAGSIQVPANGQPILLMANRQTTGGYTKIATAVYPDLAMAAQLRPGDKLRFAEVDLAEAHAITRAERRRLAHIRRLLERDIAGGPEQRMPAGLRGHTAAGPQPLLAATPTPTPTPPPAPANPQGVRTFRITIGDMEFDAEVEEMPE
ncbi:MAG: putative allophanate hydrolase [Firmicutes bacterium]|nr:putative allophanate hydrolase [Bacillota bacterium]